MGNHLQAEAIRRYHRHLTRVGRASCIEASAREWVVRYAVLWRRRYGTKLGA